MKRVHDDLDLLEEAETWLHGIDEPGEEAADSSALMFMEGCLQDQQTEAIQAPDFIAENYSGDELPPDEGNVEEEMCVSETVAALAQSLPAQYSQTTTLQQKLAHAQLLGQLRRGTGRDSVLTSWNRVTEMRGRTHFYLNIAFRDKTGSLGAITSALSQQSANILEASVYVTHDGYGLDTFLVAVESEDINRLDALVKQKLDDLPDSSEASSSRGKGALETSEDPIQLKSGKQPDATISSTSSTSSNEGELQKQLIDPKLEVPGAVRADLLEGRPPPKAFNHALQVDWEQPQFSNLALHHVLGEGGGSKVWKGLWNGNFVAVKVLKVDPTMGRDALRSFVQEAKILSQIRHPSICACLGTCMQQGFPAIVLEYLPGGSLHNLLHNRALSEDGTAVPELAARLMSRISLEIATGVAYLHDNWIMHRDIKAANVLLDIKHHAKVTDFGISTKFGQEHTAETGTYRSMAPEVISHKTYDYKCDVYSFGMLLWEIAHEQIPFHEDNALQVAYAVTMEGKRPAVNPRPELELFGDLIISCWQQDPKSRPDMEKVVQLLITIDAFVSKKSSPKTTAAGVNLRSVEEVDLSPPSIV